jgi:hypothetical protein
MITTITRYPPSSAERLIPFVGGLTATVLLALAAFGLMQPDIPEGRAVAAGTAIVIVAQRGAGE